MKHGVEKLKELKNTLVIFTCFCIWLRNKPNHKSSSPQLYIQMWYNWLCNPKNYLSSVGGSCNLQPSFIGGSISFVPKVKGGSCVFYLPHFQYLWPTPLYFSTSPLLELNDWHSPSKWRGKPWVKPESKKVTVEWECQLRRKCKHSTVIGVGRPGWEGVGRLGLSARLLL